MIKENFEKAMACYYCLRCFDNESFFLSKTIDHFIPLAKGGRNKNFNKIICCASCNKLKSDLTPDEFIDKVKNMIEWKTFGGNHTYSKEQLCRIINQVSRIQFFQSNEPIIYRRQGYFIRRMRIAS